MVLDWLRLLTTIEAAEDWQRNNIFHTSVKLHGKLSNLIIHGSSVTNIVDGK